MKLTRMFKRFNLEADLAPLGTVKRIGQLGVLRDRINRLCKEAADHQMKLK